MKIFSLKIIPAPTEGSRVVFQNNGGIFFKGEGEMDFICGNCSNILAEAVNQEQILNIVLKCSRCTKYNEIPAKWRLFLYKIEDKIYWPVFVIGLVLNIASYFTSYFSSKTTPYLREIGLLILILGYLSSIFTKKSTHYYKNN